LLNTTELELQQCVPGLDLEVIQHCFWELWGFSTWESLYFPAGIHWRCVHMCSFE